MRNGFAIVATGATWTIATWATTIWATTIWAAARSANQTEPATTASSSEVAAPPAIRARRVRHIAIVARTRRCRAGGRGVAI